MDTTGSGEATLYITKDNVTVSAADLAKAYSNENPAYVLSGLLGDDGAADSAYQEKLRELFAFSSNADAAGVKAPVGEYPITVTANPQTIAWGKTIVQGVEQVAVSNLNGGAVLSTVTLTTSTDAIGIGTIVPSDARITWGGADVTDNYALSHAGGVLTITKLPVTVNFSEAAPGASFNVADGEGNEVPVTKTTAASDTPPAAENFRGRGVFHML